MHPIRWGLTLLVAAAATGLAAILCLADVNRTEGDLGWLVVTGPEDPASPLLESDGVRGGVEESGRHDGALYYAIARNLWNLDDAAPYLDRSHYRMQRILFPAIAHTMHPSGGNGLVWAMFGIGLGGVFLGAAATSALSQLFRGPAWPGLVFGAIPGVYISLRISVPDPLALALALWAIVFSLQRRTGLAVLAGTLAVLTKESTWLVLAGFALWRRDRSSVPFVAVPAGVAAAWWLALRLLVEQQGAGVVEMTAPLAGWIEAVRFWSRGYEATGMLAAVLGVSLGVLALVKRGFRHPFGWIIFLHLCLVAVLISSAIAPERSAGRTFLPVMVLAVVALVTPGIDRSLLAPEAVDIEPAISDP